MNEVLTVGGPASEAVFDAVREVVQGHPVSTLALSSADEDLLAYERFNGTMETAFARLSRGGLSSIQVDGIQGSHLKVSVFRPRFGVENMEDWLASFEGRGLDFPSLFQSLQAMDGLTFICVSVEEMPEFGSGRVTSGNFPWSDWRLMMGAVRDHGGVWDVRAIHKTRET